MKKAKKVRIQEALRELKSMISKKYPTATFSVVRGGDRPGYYLEVFIDLDDNEKVLDLVMDRLLELQIEEKLPIDVLPLHTPEKNAQIWEQYFREHADSISGLHGIRLAS